MLTFGDEYAKMQLTHLGFIVQALFLLLHLLSEFDYVHRCNVALHFISLLRKAGDVRHSLLACVLMPCRSNQGQWREFGTRSSFDIRARLCVPKHVLTPIRFRVTF